MLTDSQVMPIRRGYAGGSVSERRLRPFGTPPLRTKADAGCGFDLEVASAGGDRRHHRQCCRFGDCRIAAGGDADPPAKGYGHCRLEPGTSIGSAGCGRNRRVHAKFVAIAGTGSLSLTAKPATAVAGVAGSPRCAHVHQAPFQAGLAVSSMPSAVQYLRQPFNSSSTSWRRRRKRRARSFRFRISGTWLRPPHARRYFHAARRMHATGFAPISVSRDSGVALFYPF